jgi:hypothetical protein
MHSWLIYARRVYPIKKKGDKKKGTEGLFFKNFQHGSDTDRAVLGLFILAACPFLALVVRLLVLVRPDISFRNLRMDAIRNG